MILLEWEHELQARASGVGASVGCSYIRNLK